MIITISGRQGAGKTTAAKELAKELSYDFISIGDLQGELALEKGITITELMTLEKTKPEIHQEIDEKTRKLGETKDNFVVEGWIAYHFIPHSYKIFLTVDEKIGCKRIFNSYRPDEPKKKTLNEALKNQKHRLIETQKGFKKAHSIDFLDQSQYDLILDTTNLTPEEVVNYIKRKLKQFRHGHKRQNRSIFDIFSKKRKTKEEKPIKIIVDYREKNSLVPSELIKAGFKLEFKELKVADFIVRNVAIERKTVNDFISSMKNRRLIRQLEEIQQYKNRLLIIEGIDEQDLYTDSEKGIGVHPNAVRGFLLSILLKYHVPIIFSKDAQDTAKFISLIGKKKTNSELSLNVNKKYLNQKERMEFIMEGFPGIGPKTAKKLLKKFKTLKQLVGASEEELKEIIGKKAELIFKIINKKY